MANNVIYIKDNVQTYTYSQPFYGHVPDEHRLAKVSKDMSGDCWSGILISWASFLIQMGKKLKLWVYVWFEFFGDKGSVLFGF